jgi:soluble lytic murein transglycosylase-like protein
VRAARIVVGALLIALLGQATALATTGHPPAKRAPAPAAPAPPSTYVVRPGDNLETIAKRFNTTVAALASANKVRNKNLIVIGTRLKLPAASAPASTAAMPARLRAHPDRATLGPRFDYWAARYGVPADLLKGLAWYESGWQNHVVSKTGAVGIGQLEPFTSDFVAETLLKNPALDPAKADDNIRMSARFLRFLLDQTGGAAGLALAAYYQGLARTQQGKFYEDTKRYVAGVSSTRLQFRRAQ